MKILTLDDASGYGGQQYYVDDAGNYAGLVPAQNNNQMANSVASIENLKAQSGLPSFVQPEINTMEIAPATFSSGSPLPMANPNNLSDIEQLKLDSGLTNIYGMENPNNQFDDTTNPLEMQPIQPSLTPIQQAAQALQDKINEVGISTFSRKSDDDRAIRFADGTNLLDKDILAEYGVGRKEFLDAIDDLGVGRGNLFRKSRGGSTGAFQTGLENILLSPEERIIAEQEYADAQAAARRSRRKEKKEQQQRDATRNMLDTQVAREAEALGISTDDYYNLGFPMRARMAGADIAEVFDPSLGKLFQDPNDARPNNPRNLGVLSAENIKRFQDAFPEGISPERQDKMGSAEDLMFMGQADSLLDPPSGFTIPGTNITITAPEGDMRSDGGYGGGAGSGSGDRYGRRPRFGAFANISGGGGGGIWDRFRDSYLTNYGLEGQSEEMDEIKVSYDPETNVYFYPDGTPIDPADLEGLNISDTFEEQIGTERFKLQKEIYMAEETLDEQINRLLRNQSGAAISDQERATMQGSMPPMPPMPRPEIQMINNAQMGLMEMDPVATKDIVDGLEITKNKVKAGGQLTEVESTGIMSILQKLGGALSGIMSRGDRKTYMVDGNPVEMTEGERMSAINAGMLVQDMETFQVDDRMERMTPDSYRAKVARGEITPDELMMESSGSTMTDAERAISANEEFNRRVQEEQERMFRMNNPPVTSSVRPRLRQQEGFLVSPTPNPDGIPAVPMPNVMPDLSPEEMDRLKTMMEIRKRQSLERDPSGMTQLLGG